MSDKRYLKIPGLVVGVLDFRAYAEFVVNTSPVYKSRLLLRLGIQALTAINSADDDGVVEMTLEAAETFARAVEVADIPRLFVRPQDGDGNPLPGHFPTPIGATAYGAFFDAVDAMTEARPEPTPLPVAAE